MKAIVQRRFGGPEVLEVDHIELPPLGPTDVLVRVHAAALNPVDLGTRAGRVLERATFPLVLGWDLAGEVEEIGSDVRKVKVGERVIGMSVQPATQRGTHAERVVVDQDDLASIDEADAVAAALPLAGVTAWQALAALEGKGETLLIGSVRSAVGELAAQLARHRGWTVFAVADDPESRADAAQVGVRPLQSAKVDAALDVRGAGHALRVFDRVRDGGAYATVVPEWWRPGGAFQPARGITPIVIQVKSDRDALIEIARLADRAILRPRVGAIFALEEAAAAHARLASGQTRGKVVFAP